MDHNDDNTLAEHLRPELIGKDLYDIEMYFREEGHSEFVYDEEDDLFRFEDGRFAFSRTEADLKLLEERGYSA